MHCMALKLGTQDADETASDMKRLWSTGDAVHTRTRPKPNLIHYCSARVSGVCVRVEERVYGGPTADVASVTCRGY